MRPKSVCVLLCLIVALAWSSNALATLIQLRATGEITGGRDARCLFGDSTCVVGSQDGFLFTGAGISIEAIWTFDPDTAPPDNDARPTNSQRSDPTDWIDLELRLFDQTSSFAFSARSFVSEPDNLLGVLNIADEASESIFVEARYNDGFGATDPTQNILRGDMGIGVLGLLSSDTLTESFTWRNGVDPGAGGFGEFDVFQCEASSGCTFEMDGTFRVDLLTVTVLNDTRSVPAPAPLPLLAAGLLSLALVRHRRKGAASS